MELNVFITRFFSAVAQENRIKILRFLQDGERCVCEILPALSIEQSNLSKHLKILSDAGILESRKEGISVYYRIKDERIFKIIGIAENIVSDELIKWSKLIKVKGAVK
jgi:ArsR family transcriptional regulator